MSRGDLSIDQLLTLLNNKVRHLSTFGNKYESTFVRLDAELRLTINTIRPVNRLPPEVLTEIFAFLHPRILHRYRPLIHAMHVCRHWKNLISSTPSNWTWINPKWAELIPLSLRLSEFAPIEVEVSSIESFSHSSVDVLLPYSERIASFTLTFSAATRSYYCQIVSGLRCMSNIRMLSIIAEPELTPCWLPILSGSIPHLESITLPFSSYAQQVVQLANLTTVNITVEYSALTDVVELFASNPKLRSATLCGSFRDKSCQRKHGAVRMGSLRQLDLLSWSTTSLLPFLSLKKGAHIRVFGPVSILETVSAWDLSPPDTRFLPNLVGLKQLRWYLMTHNTLMEFTGPNGSLSILLPMPEVQAFAIDSFPLGEVEELYCEPSSASDLAIGTKELNQIIASMIPTMNQLRQVTFAMCTNTIIQVVLSNLDRATHLKSITLSHCDHPDPTRDIFRALLLFAKGRISVDAKLEEIRVICRVNAQRTELLDRMLSKVVKSFVLVRQSPWEMRRTNIEIQRSFPASIQKTCALYP
ncbi:hypothetical protein BDM02DRAFT_3186196 [Thelephora ganbajun]|uniref:Uncharacterized protein n=1 Tax=Thelephora ganbajun TaxID=370292 RepID=A0ACB6ZJD2_THEGA|nr:hypothetical protein BDM02DRAFT_3186196 [Thelephora ganbajun]